MWLLRALQFVNVLHAKVGFPAEIMLQTSVPTPPNLLPRVAMIVLRHGAFEVGGSKSLC